MGMTHKAAGSPYCTSDTINYTGYVNAGLVFWLKGTSALLGTLTVYYSTNGGTDWTT
jgi:hypothetical protein